MKKNLLIFCLFNYLVFFGFSQIFADRDYSNGFDVVRFNAGCMFYTPFYDGDQKDALTYTSKYTFVTENSIDYLLCSDGKIKGIKKFLVLATKNIIFLYTGDNTEPWFCGFSDVSPRMYEALWIDRGQFINPSSELIEADRKYSVTNLGTAALNAPWVEGVPGSGIGESFVIKLKPDGGDRQKVSGLIISNGYVSFEKPYLYTKNQRLKQLKIMGMDSKNTILVNLLDTPHPQYIKIPFEKNENLKIMITQVYAGTTYRDTCLNFIISYFGVDIE